MVKHIRKVFRPTYLHQNFSLTGTPPGIQLQSIGSVDADNPGGTLIRNLLMTASVGLNDTADALKNTDANSGHFGYFKWPIDAAAPTTATLDFENRSKVFGRVPYAIIGENAVRISSRIKTVTLRPGDELFAYWFKGFETATVIDTKGQAIYQFWVNSD